MIVYVSSQQVIQLKDQLVMIGSELLQIIRCICILKKKNNSRVAITSKNKTVHV